MIEHSPNDEAVDVSKLGPGFRGLATRREGMRLIHETTTCGVEQNLEREREMM